jgi:hypothetical protein
MHSNNMLTEEDNRADEANTIKRQSTWLCLHFSALALDMVMRDEQNPDLPLVVTEKQRVYLANKVASELGIKPGQSMDTAFTLSDRVTSIERHPDRESHA